MKNDKNIKSFGWIAEREAGVVGIADCDVSPTVVVSRIPPWFFPMPNVDFQIQIKMKNEKATPKNIIVQEYLEQNYSSWLNIYTDGSKEPISGRTAAAVYIPQN